ncbi:MAG: histidinol-phosphatase [Ignavibacteriaceae bacterium]|nr:histidinol-phosphatase [Ignavibacteriaceae bacterium]
MEELIEYQQFAKQLCHLSGEVIKKYFREQISVDQKIDNSPVTIADRKAEEIMREAILKEFPDDGILGEEFGVHQGKSQYKWILDPIDGTKSFICGAISFGTLIALTKNDNPVLGVFHQPILNELLYGDNKNTVLNEQKVLVRECESISNAVLLTTDHLNIEKYQNAKRFDSLIRQVKLYRGWGDCYGYYLLSTGFVDIMVDPIMSYWDIAALVPIVKGAGGIITDFHGNDPLKGNSAVASSAKIHAQVIQELNS